MNFVQMSCSLRSFLSMALRRRSESEWLPGVWEGPIEALGSVSLSRLVQEGHNFSQRPGLVGHASLRRRGQPERLMDAAEVVNRRVRAIVASWFSTFLEKA